MASKPGLCYYVAVLCGSLEEFHFWVKANNLFRISDSLFIKEFENRTIAFQYAPDFRSVRGRSYCRHFIYGTFWNKQNAQETYDSTINRIRAKDEIPESFWEELEKR